MISLPRLRASWWILPTGCLVALVVMHAVRAQRGAQLTELASPAVTVDRASPTGYAHGWRKLIVPEPNHDSYQWIVQTQQQLARGVVRVRHVDYDNAPAGRMTHTASPYRWWLSVVAAAQSMVSGQPVAVSVEQAAWSADPWLHGLFLVGSVAWVAWQFGGMAAALVGAGVVFLFPLGGAFIPGRPDDFGLSLMAAFGSVLALVTGLRGKTGMAKPRGWFAVGGVCGAIGLWLDVAIQFPLLVGLALGGGIAAVIERRSSVEPPSSARPWRWWGLAGAAGTLAAYAIEYLPGAGAEWELRAIHPLYGLAWLGMAELVARNATTRGAPASPGGRRPVLAILLAVAAVASLPAAMKFLGSRGFLAMPTLADRLTEVRGGVAASNVVEWLMRDGFRLPFWATIIPLALVAAVAWQLIRTRNTLLSRTALVVALGPVLVAVGFALVQLRWWSVVDASLLAVVPLVFGKTAVGVSQPRRRWVALATVALLIPGALLLLPVGDRRGGAAAASEADVQALVERDLAYWLANRRVSSGAIVLAPPQLTAALIYHGGLRGLGSPYWENRDGFAAAVRLCSPTSPDEAQALFEGRGVTHVVLPSWDDFLQVYARLGSHEPNDTLIALLERWLPPRWLRPVPYQLPLIEGFRARSVLVYEVVELQEQNLALSRLADYFVEMGQLNEAAAVAATLAHLFPEDLDAMVAQAQVHAAREDGRAFGESVRALLARLGSGRPGGLGLEFDRRVALAGVLAQARLMEPARTVVENCLADADEAALRSLSTTALFRLLTLSDAFGREIPDPKLRSLPLRLLPPDLRDQLPGRK